MDSKLRTIAHPAPLPRSFKRRLSDELKAIPVDTAKALVLDVETGRALASFGKYHGWKTVRRKAGPAQVLFWRIE